MAVARRYEELDVWQIADELKLEVYALVATGPASHDQISRPDSRFGGVDDEKHRRRIWVSERRRFSVRRCADAIMKVQCQL